MSHIYSGDVTQTTANGPVTETIIASPLPISLAVSEATTSGSVLTFAVNPASAGVVAGMLPRDITTPAAIAAGTSVASLTSTTITMSAAVASEVFSGDTIEFFSQTTVVSTDPGFLCNIRVLSAQPGATVTCYDNASAASGKVIAPNSNLGASLARGVILNYGLPFANGLSIALTGTITIKVSTQQ